MSSGCTSDNASCNCSGSSSSVVLRSGVSSLETRMSALLCKNDLLRQAKGLCDLGYDRGMPTSVELDTLAIHAGQRPDPETGAVMPPIHLSSTFAQNGPGQHRG